MGIEGIEEITSDRVEEKPIPSTDMICKCGHSLARHIPYNSSKNMVCIEHFCPCSQFKLNHVK
jgi:hypothetical protein